MDWLVVAIIAFGLAMDAFAVSLASGVRLKKVKARHAITIGSAFGLFQFGMPLIGFAAGSYMEHYIRALDHWIAFLLLAYIGIKMMRESFEKEGSLKSDPFRPKNLLFLSIATSIDALTAGFSMALINMPILLPAAVIGVVTFAMSYAGVYLGNRSGSYLGKKASLLGGLLLIGIGAKILAEHMLF